MTALDIKQKTYELAVLMAEANFTSIKGHGHYIEYWFNDGSRMYAWPIECAVVFFPIGLN